MKTNEQNRDSQNNKPQETVFDPQADIEQFRQAVLSGVAQIARELIQRRIKYAKAAKKEKQE